MSLLSQKTLKKTATFSGVGLHNGKLAKVLKEISRLSKKYNLIFIPFLLEGVALNPELNLNDGMHPNPKGVKIISKTIEKKLIPLLN